MRSAAVGFCMHAKRYLNIAQESNISCGLFEAGAGLWNLQDRDLSLRSLPSIAEVMTAAVDEHKHSEIVFCGLGEPTRRLYTLLEVAHLLHDADSNLHIELKTDGLANAVHGRDITPDLEDNINAITVMMFAHDSDTYNRYCKSDIDDPFPAMLDFVKRARNFVSDITVTAFDGLPDVDIGACEDLAQQLQVNFLPRRLDAIG